MAEWTSEKREELYAALAAGDLKQALEIITPFKALKQSDFSPKNQKALKAFVEKLRENELLCQQLVESLPSKSETIRRFALFCVKSIASLYPDFPTAPFRKTFDVEIKLAMDETNKRKKNFEENWGAQVKDHPNLERQWFLSSVYGEHVKNNKDLTQLMKGMAQFPSDEMEALISSHSAELKLFANFDIFDAFEKNRARFLAKQKKTTVAKPKIASKTETTFDRNCLQSVLNSFMESDDIQAFIDFQEKYPGLETEQLDLESIPGFPQTVQKLQSNESLVCDLFELLSMNSKTSAAIATLLLKKVDPLPYKAIIKKLTDKWKTNKALFMEKSFKKCLISIYTQNLYPETFIYMGESELREWFVLNTAKHLMSNKILDTLCKLNDISNKLRTKPYQNYFCSSCDLTSLELKKAFESKLPLWTAAVFYTPPKDVETLTIRAKRAVDGEHDALLEYFTRWDEEHLKDYHAPKHQGVLMRQYADCPQYHELIGSRVAECLRANDYGTVDWGARMACTFPDTVRSIGEAPLELLSLGLWRTKSAEIRDTIFRIHYFAEQSHCTPQEAIDTISQVFDTDQSAAWNHAARSIKDLLKLDKDATVNCADRLNEIIEIDSKYKKTFAPLLKRTEN